MALIDQIKADQLAARKERRALAAALLTTLLGEVGIVAKNAGRTDATDEEVIATVKKFIKNNESIPDGARNVTSHDAELHTLEEYLPKQLTRDELVAIKATGTFANKGEWMKHLKENYAGRYDGKLASEVF
jgi:uncharacterized protein YqeY